MIFDSGVLKTSKCNKVYSFNQNKLTHDETFNNLTVQNSIKKMYEYNLIKLDGKSFYNLAAALFTNAFSACSICSLLKYCDSASALPSNCDALILIFL